MRGLHIDCGNGAAGDMLLGALATLDAHDVDTAGLVASLGLPGVSLRLERRGPHAKAVVDAPPAAAHRHLPDILDILDASPLTEGARRLARAAFQRLAEAEAAVHGVPVESVHFHEVGAADSIVDIAATAALLDALGPDVVTCTRLNLGSGTVTGSHGALPVPAPATERILRDAGVMDACFQEDTGLEMATPTAAAILTTVAPPERWGVAPRFTAAPVEARAVGDHPFPKPRPLVARYGPVAARGAADGAADGASEPAGA